jgi:hypothetical protein
MVGATIQYTELFRYLSGYFCHSILVFSNKKDLLKNILKHVTVQISQRLWSVNIDL